MIKSSNHRRKLSIIFVGVLYAHMHSWSLQWMGDIYMIRRRYEACTVNTEQYTGREIVSKVLHCIYPHKGLEYEHIIVYTYRDDHMYLDRPQDRSQCMGLFNDVNLW